MAGLPSTRLVLWPYRGTTICIGMGLNSIKREEISAALNASVGEDWRELTFTTTIVVQGRLLTVERPNEPGMLVIDGEKRYSDAWF